MAPREAATTINQNMYHYLSDAGEVPVLLYDQDWGCAYLRGKSFL
jgi:hypothetical protein